MPLQKAVIEILDQQAIDPKRGLPDRRITVQFNPTEYTLSKGAQIAEISIPGIDSPLLQFIHGQNEKLTLDLFFDTTEQGMDEKALDVRKQTESIYQLVKIQPNTHAPLVFSLAGVACPSKRSSRASNRNSPCSVLWAFRYAPPCRFPSASTRLWKTNCGS